MLLERLWREVHKLLQLCYLAEFREFAEKSALQAKKTCEKMKTANEEMSGRGKRIERTAVALRLVMLMARSIAPAVTSMRWLTFALGDVTSNTVRRFWGAVRTLSLSNSPRASGQLAPYVPFLGCGFCGSAALFEAFFHFALMALENR